MKKLLFISGLVVVFMTINSCQSVLLEEPINVPELKSGNMGNDKLTGFNEWGYNWNAHEFCGYFYNAIVGDNLYAANPWSHTQAYNGNDEDIIFPELTDDLIGIAWYLRKVHLVMKWNEALVSKEGVYPENLDEWIGSEAWITFKYSGLDENGNRWSQFQKMVAAHVDDELKEDGIWYNNDDVEIGLFNDWTQLILVQVVNTGEPPFPFNQIPSYKNTARLGFGKNKNR